MKRAAEKPNQTPARRWEACARIKIIFPDSITGGAWWQIANPKNEMTVLAQDPEEARHIINALNSHDALVKALQIAQRWIMCDDEFGDPEQFEADATTIRETLAQLPASQEGTGA